MPAFEIPLTASPQRLSIALAGVPYTLQVVWNAASSCWIVDIMDASGIAILMGLPLVTGVDLLAQFEYLNFGGQLWVQSDSDLNKIPDFSSLGSTGHVYFVVV